MGKGQITRELILAKSARLFNTRGFAGASMSEIMKATGLEKGGIYNHFSSKEELAAAAFEYACARAGSQLKEFVEKGGDGLARLHLVIEAFENIRENPPIEGGCPIMNTAIECDDGSPAMKELVNQAMKRLELFVAQLCLQGQGEGIICREADAQQVSTFIIASLEGGLMISRLRDDGVALSVVARNLHHWLETLRV
jgi:AcrR family transcriptional regulator